MLLARVLLLFLLVLLGLAILYIAELSIVSAASPLADTDDLLSFGALLIACAVVLKQLQKLQHQ